MPQFGHFSGICSTTSFGVNRSLVFSCSGCAPGFLEVLSSDFFFCFFLNAFCDCGPRSSTFNILFTRAFSTFIFATFLSKSAKRGTSRCMIFTIDFTHFFSSVFSFFSSVFSFFSLSYFVFSFAFSLRTTRFSSTRRSGTIL